MEDANSSDELWVAVKSQSNLVIAGSPRNAFRCSPLRGVPGVELLDGPGASPARPNSEYRHLPQGSETVGDKLRGRKGNNPHRQLRPPNPG